MKKIFTVLFLLILSAGIFFIGTFYPKDNFNTYLRIHIRANSNFQQDQLIKYEIKDEIISFLTPVISNCSSKEDFVWALNQNLNQIECIADKILAQNNFDYSATAKINNEYFPVRSYENLTLESGFYDALIINLGKAEGDNWWCVVYPPLCFLNANANYKYKSRIAEIIKKFFGG